MESSALNRYVTRYVTGVMPLAVLSLLLIASLLMMNAAAQNSALFGRLYSALLLVNILGIVLLIVLILLNLSHLIKQYRARVMGTRLTLRLLTMFVLLAVLPVSVVFLFSVQTLNRGIDNWFDVKIERALDDALLLGRTALDALQQDLVKSTQEIAAELENLPSGRDGNTARSFFAIIEYLREQHGITELTLFTQDGKIIASSSQEGPETGTLIPDRPSDAVLTQARQGLPYANLDAVGKAGLRMRAVVPVISRDVSAPVRVLQALQTLPPRYTKLGESVQTAFAEYEKLVYLRGPLKFGFTLTLSLVTLLTLLIAVWAAIFSARRLAEPIRELAEGTRAVARGEYRKQLPVTSRDEIGILVASFNDMTRRIHRASMQIKRSQQEAEMQRAYLETVLTNLSSGVLSFDLDQVLRTHNAAANQILGIDLTSGEGQPLAWMGEQHTPLQPFVLAVQEAMTRHAPEWQIQVVLSADNNPRTLMLHGTRLPLVDDKHGGYAVVFDDVTTLIQAQRDAAWGEVARRMAHEIKNPLTPIQLSAERIRNKYLPQLADDDRATLDRATRTIIEQVESLKSMVNAFSEYARGARMLALPINLNDLIRDVAELYKNARAVTIPSVVSLRGARANAKPPKAASLKLELDDTLPLITADAGRLRQVLHNLLLNARDALAASPKPAIRVNTRTVEKNMRRYVELKIQDNGPGFPEALLGRLFEPYVTSKEKGTGLGLAIVKRIVEEHRGSIFAENLKNRGAVVTILLPVEQAIATGAAASNKPARLEKKA